MNDGLNGALVGILREKGRSLFVGLSIHGGATTAIPATCTGIAAVFEQVGYFDYCACGGASCKTRH